MISLGRRCSITISLLFVAPLSGCITVAGMRIGNRMEHVDCLQRAVRRDDQLVIDYRVIPRTQVFFGQVITRDVRGWSAVDLRSLHWQSPNASRPPRQVR